MPYCAEPWAVIIAAALEIDFRALPGETVLHFNDDGAGERVEAEDGIAGDDLCLTDGGRRNQIPVDDIAIGFVDADAVHIDREAFGRARHRGRGLTAEIDRFCERAAD